MAFDKKLLEIIACPVCKGKLLALEDKDKGAFLLCKFDRLRYEIKEGIPVLLEEQATKLSIEELESIV